MADLKTVLSEAVAAAFAAEGVDAALARQLVISVPTNIYTYTQTLVLGYGPMGILEDGRVPPSH